MALLNFPPNPTVGQRYTIGTNTWVWNGVAWIKYNNPNVTIPILTVTQSLTVTSSTQSTSTTTGAVVINGGVGIGGNINVGGTINVSSAGNESGGGGITAGSITANSGTFKTLTVTSTTNSINPNTGALVVKGGVGIAGNLWLGGRLYAGGGLVLTTASFENSLSAGTDISITTVGGGVLRISNTSTLYSVTQRGNTTPFGIKVTNTSNSISTTTGAITVTGGVGIGKDIRVGGDIYANNVYANNLALVAAIFASNQVSVNTTATTQIDSYSLSSFRAAKYVIQVDDGTGPAANFEVVELLILVDNAGNIYITEYARVTTPAGSLGDYSADIQGDNVVRLYITPFDASNKVVNVVRTALVV